MKALLIFTTSIALLVAIASPGATNSVTPESLSKDRVAFYSIALACPSAPKLGCGSRAKRVLTTLTADERVAAAWVNETGTRLAIGWRHPSDALTSAQLNETLAPHGLAVNPIGEKRRAELSASFRTNQGWFDTRTIDELSRKESAVIADRLVKRLASRVPVTKKQRTILVSAIMTSCWDRGGCQVDKDVTTIAAAAKLDSSGSRALSEVIALGYRPLENEE